MSLVFFLLHLIRSMVGRNGKVHSYVNAQHLLTMKALCFYPEILSNVVDCLSSGCDPRGYGSDSVRRLKPITHDHPIMELSSSSYQGHQMRNADFAISWLPDCGS